MMVTGLLFNLQVGKQRQEEVERLGKLIRTMSRPGISDEELERINRDLKYRKVNRQQKIADDFRDLT